jgi:hypothetical protein
VMKQNGSVTESCNLGGLSATCTFDGTASTPASDITTYAWVIKYLNNTVNLTGPTPSHNFSCFGENSSVAMKVTLTVSGPKGSDPESKDLTLFKAGCGT